MPKRANAKKMAAQTYAKIKSLDAATTEGKYYIARVEKALGNCGFEAVIELPNGKLHNVQVLVRGKMKGGRACATRVEVGCFVLADGDIEKKVLEVVGVVNRQAELDKLKKSGRVSKSFTASAEKRAADEDDLFESDGEDDREEDIWNKKDEERSAEAAQILGRYMKREAEGVRYRAAAAERAVEGGRNDDDGEADDADAWTDDEDAGASAAGGGPAPRRPRRAKKVVTFVPEPAEAADGLNLWEAGAAVREVDDAEVADAWAVPAAKFLATRKVPDRWDADDDLDIDTI